MKNRPVYGAPVMIRGIDQSSTYKSNGTLMAEAKWATRAAELMDQKRPRSSFQIDQLIAMEKLAAESNRLAGNGTMAAEHSWRARDLELRREHAVFLERLRRDYMFAVLGVCIVVMLACGFLWLTFYIARH